MIVGIVLGRRRGHHATFTQPIAVRPRRGPTRGCSGALRSTCSSCCGDSSHSFIRNLTIGIPFTHIYLVQFNTNSVVIPFNAAVIALGLNEGAYFSEIVRSGLIAVDEGQTEAAMSLGMTRGQTLRLVVLPQAMRVIIPPTGNEVISMLKTTSLVVALGGGRPARGRHQHLHPDVPDHADADSRQPLVLDRVDDSFNRPVLPRAITSPEGALRTPPPTPIQRIRRDLRGIASKYRTSRGVQVGATP